MTATEQPKTTLPEIYRRRFKLALCSECLRIAYEDDDGIIRSDCICSKKDEYEKYVYYQANEEDKREQSYKARDHAIVERLKIHLTNIKEKRKTHPGLQILQYPVEDLIREFEGK